MKYINKFDSINESKGSAIREIKAWSAVVKAEIKSIMLSNLKPGTDRGSSQAVIDVRDIDKAANEIFSRMNDMIDELRKKLISLQDIDGVTKEAVEKFAEELRNELEPQLIYPSNKIFNYGLNKILKQHGVNVKNNK